MKNYTWERNGYTVTTDLSRVDVEKVIRLPLEHDWPVRNRPLHLTRKALHHSLPFLCLHGQEPIGFLRLVTDYATFAYVTDVNIAKAHQGKGLARFLLDCVFEHPEVCHLRRFMLVTDAAHGLYSQVGFTSGVCMERLLPYETCYRMEPSDS